MSVRENRYPSASTFPRTYAPLSKCMLFFLKFIDGPPALDCVPWCLGLPRSVLLTGPWVEDG